jgi:hypothetical protein
VRRYVQRIDEHAGLMDGLGRMMECGAVLLRAQSVEEAAELLGAVHADGPIRQ